MSRSPILYPSITSLPGQSGVRNLDQTGPKKQEGVPSEFDEVLNQIKPPLKFSAHAFQRIKDRRIDIDPATMSKINDAVDRAEAKGVEDTLVLTKDAALIISVKNRTVVTAVDRNAVSGNVFTNIDGAVVI
ncbi:MAG: TIGR02530 family flagellar biosynthesis protein [Bdellovibrionia bacterium]